MCPGLARRFPSQNAAGCSVRRVRRTKGAPVKRCLLIVSLLLTIIVVVPVPAQAATEQLDQSAPIGSRLTIVSSSSSSIGQTFTAGLTGRLTRIQLGLDTLAESVSLTIEIRTTDANGVPTGQGEAGTGVVLASATLAPEDTSHTWTDITFADPPNIVSGATYAIVAVPTGIWGWYGPAEDVDVYTSGVFAVCSPGTACSLPPSIFDQAFETYVEPTPGSVSINNDAAYTNSFDATLSLTCQDAFFDCHQMEFSNNANTWFGLRSFTTSVAVTLGTGNGPQTIYVRFYNATGDMSDVISDTIVLDRIAPETTIDTSPPSLSNSTSAAFTFSGLDTNGISGFQCLLDDGLFASCTSGVSYSNLTEGEHTFQVRSIDPAGNVDATPETWTWTVDATAPTVTINQAAGQADPTNATSITFDVEFSEPVSGFDAGDIIINRAPTLSAPAITINPSAGPGSSYTVTLSNLTGDGAISASIVDGAAQDAAANGNLASTSTDNTVTIDQTAPTTTATVTGPQGQQDWFRSATVTLSTTEPATTTYTIDGGDSQTYSGPFLLTTDGFHTVTFTSVDAVGNQTPIGVRMVAVDGTAPVIQPLADQSLDPTSPQGAPVIFTPLVTDNLSSAGFITATCADQLNNPFASGQIAPVGMTTITCTATDLAGNTASESFVVTVRSAGDLLAQLRADTITYVTNLTAERALLATLDRIQQEYARGNTWGVYTSILTYVIQMDRYVDTRAVSAANAHQLISDARTFLDGVM
jgi:hypothetical protein